MAGKDDFTEQEWETMQRGVTGSGMLVSVADRGFFDTFKEVGALSTYLKQAREKSSSELVKQLAEVRGTGFGLTDSPDEVESKTVEALQASMATLKAKAPDDAEAYGKFVLDVASAVGDAADEIGAKETGAIDKIKTALQTTQTTPATPTTPST